MPLSMATAKSLVNSAVSGHLNALGQLLRALCLGQPYSTSAGTPIGNVTPEDIGQLHFDTTNLFFYRATGKTNTSWAKTGGSNTVPIAAGAALTLTRAAHDGKTILLDTLAGSVVTLPAATGSGARYRFLVSVLATSVSHKIQVANSTDVIQGIIAQLSDNAAAVLAWAAGATGDTITLNRSTTGSVFVGEWLEIYDYAAGFFQVSGMIGGTGTEATPFSAAV